MSSVVQSALLGVVLLTTTTGCDRQREQPEGTVTSDETPQSEPAPASEAQPPEPTAAEDRTVNWSLQTLQTWPDAQVSLTARDVVALSPDGETFAVGSARWVKVWRDGVPPTGTSSVQFGRFLQFDPSGDVLHVGFERYDLEVDAFEGPSRRETQQALRSGLDSASGVDSGNFEIQSLARSDDGSQILVSANFRSHPGSPAGSYDGPRQRLLLLDGTNGDAVAVVAEDGLGWTSSAVGDELMAAGGITVQLWRRANAEHVADLTGLASGATTLAFSADRQHLLAGCNAGTICVWSIADATAVTCSDPHGEGTAVVRAHPSQPVFVTGGADGIVALRSTTAPDEPLASISIGHPVLALALNSSGDRLLVASRERTRQLDLLAVDMPD